MNKENRKMTKYTSLVLSIFALTFFVVLYQNCAPSGDAGGTAIRSSSYVPPGASTSQSTLTANPTLTTATIGSQFQIYVTGGTPPYTIKLNSGTGQVTATGYFVAPLAAETDLVQVSDSAGAGLIITIKVVTTIATPTPSTSTGSTGSVTCGAFTNTTYYAGLNYTAPIASSQVPSMATCTTYCEAQGAAVCTYNSSTMTCSVYSSAQLPQGSGLPDAGDPLYTATCM